MSPLVSHANLLANCSSSQRPAEQGRGLLGSTIGGASLAALQGAKTGEASRGAVPGESCSKVLSASRPGSSGEAAAMPEFRAATLDDALDAVCGGGGGCSWNPSAEETRNGILSEIRSLCTPESAGWVLYGGPAATCLQRAQPLQLGSAPAAAAVLANAPHDTSEAPN